MNQLGTFGNRSEEMKHVHFDFLNYSSSMNEVTIPITRTFFNNGILPINTKCLDGFDISTANLTGLIAFKDPAFPQYDGMYPTSINVRKKVWISNSYSQKKDCDVKLTSSSPIDLAMFQGNDLVERGSIDYFGKLDALQNHLETVFSATKFASQLEPDNQDVDLGETLSCEVGYMVQNSKGFLCLLIKQCNILADDRLISIRAHKNVPAGICRSFENIFSRQHIRALNNTQKSGTDILWYEPIGWEDIHHTKDYESVCNAVYMWQGHAGNKLSIFIGYVCNRSLRSALEEDIRKYPGIKIDRFRYSELINAGKLKSKTVLQIVAQQSGIHISAITDTFKAVVTEDGTEYSWELLTDVDAENYVESGSASNIDLTDLTENHPRDDDFYPKIQKILRASHCCVQGDTTIRDNLWFQSTPWLTRSNEIEQAGAQEATFALYMWKGHNQTDPAQKYLYIGIVGVDKKDALNKNTVWKRIFVQEQKDKIRKANNVLIDEYRYVRMIDDSNVFDDNAAIRSELLKTVEMQTINHVSSLFGYSQYSLQASPELVIRPLFKGVTVDRETYSVHLLNNNKRYHNIAEA